MINYLYGFASPFILVLLVLFIARQWRAMREWYVGTKITKWWAMGLFIFALKNLSTTILHTQRGQGRIWISPKHPLFEDPNTIK